MKTLFAILGGYNTNVCGQNKGETHFMIVCTTHTFVINQSRGWKIRASNHFSAISIYVQRLNTDIKSFNALWSNCFIAMANMRISTITFGWK